MARVVTGHYGRYEISRSAPRPVVAADHSGHNPPHSGLARILLLRTIPNLKKIKIILYKNYTLCYTK